jgi:hypothetical protein
MTSNSLAAQERLGATAAAGRSSLLNLYSKHAELFLFRWVYLPDNSQQLVPRFTEVAADGNRILMVEQRFEAVVLGDSLHPRDNDVIAMVVGRAITSTAMTARM